MIKKLNIAIYLLNEHDFQIGKIINLDSISSIKNAVELLINEHKKDSDYFKKYISFDLKNFNLDTEFVCFNKDLSESFKFKLIILL